LNNSTINIRSLAFEVDYEYNLVKLCEEINNGIYQIGRSIAFKVDKPVKREIFAADFRDRVVHHFLIGKLNRLFEKQFINDSYSCRVGNLQKT
jgi:RNA-directed DNA polymerase